eukprot:CAMPEP_0181191662 /NCGR_PEP_ID=MMETSP1096-20121128/12855_1 /TAXON_ID=156174 ORGANISM="Chrysochromulina ericina, Strain CCMP281" /NCGR_SAMPLE_ID=MMETSP1096 /ASSEMBLY_ACC=CAM_ASM_000453 /LENGTH=102 /DNA_ID=CAMNT_0023280977 /DNA_START=177 /DNA_END=482 /DNA_ORIENTATION=-
MNDKYLTMNPTHLSISKKLDAVKTTDARCGGSPDGLSLPYMHPGVHADRMIGTRQTRDCTARERHTSTVGIAINTNNDLAFTRYNPEREPALLVSTASVGDT